MSILLVALILRALSGIPLTRHRIDHQAQRYGVLTTEEVSGIVSYDVVNCVINHAIIVWVLIPHTMQYYGRN